MDSVEVTIARRSAGGGEGEGGGVAEDLACIRLSTQEAKAAVEKDGVDFMFPGENMVLPYVSNEILQWPDSMSAPVVSRSDEEYFLYVTASQVDKAPFIQGARPRRNTFGLYKVPLHSSLVQEILKRSQAA